MTEIWQMSGLALGNAIAKQQVSAVEVLDAVVTRVEAVNPYAVHDLLVTFFQKYELFLTPTLATPAYPSSVSGPSEVAGVPVASPLEPFFTYPFNLSGQPAASIPVGFTDNGLPIGLQIVGRRFAEKTILRASACFEEAYPWANRWPKL